MLSEQWLNQQIGTVFAYWESRIPAEDLQVMCVERVFLMIRTYREDEDPEQYRTYIENRVQLLSLR